MSSIVLAAPFILRMLTGIYTLICSSFRNVSHFPPQVPSLLAGYVNGLLYVLSPCTFLFMYRQWNGPLYRVSLGFLQLVVFSSGDAIYSVLSTSPELLNGDTLHKRVFYAVAGVRTNYAHLHAVTTRELYPLLDKSLSLHSLCETTHMFGHELLSHIKEFTRNHTGPISLTQLTNQPLFAAINLVLFGTTFSSHAYRDFRTLDKSVPYRFCGMLLWHWPSHAARTRLLRSLMDYLQRGGGDTQFSRDFMRILKDNKIQPSEGAQLILTFLWTLHSNVLNNAFFLLSFLLSDPEGLMRVRAEIDSAIEQFGGLEEALRAGPGELDDPSFELLTSAIMETLRFTGLHAGIYQAPCDFVLRLNDSDGTMVSIKKGECVFGDIHAAHMDETVFQNPETFVVDRFAQRPYQRKHLQTEGYPFYSFGGGRHLCKGRWLALYEIKVLVIILLYTFDFSPTVENSTGWSLPRVHSRSIGVAHTDDDVFVRLSPRQAKNDD